jgi:hypothetical protein
MTVDKIPRKLFGRLTRERRRTIGEMEGPVRLTLRSERDKRPRPLNDDDDDDDAQLDCVWGWKSEGGGSDYQDGEEEYTAE